MPPMKLGCFPRFRMNIGYCSATRRLLHYITVVVVEVALILALLLGLSISSGQNRSTSSITKSQNASIAKTDSVESAITNICEARRRDSQGTVPIDEMAFSRPLPLTDPRVIAAKSRAQKLLPTAKQLVPFALRRVAIINGLEPLNLKWIITRVQAVKNIRADTEERDNSSWRPTEPDTILLGTVFLAGLRSDEAMIAVLAHELTHAINGTDEGLQPIFTRLGAKTSQLGMPVGSNATVELACEMVGLEVVRDYISQTKGRGIGSRQRLARAFQKDCVRTDLGDANHLSPHETMLTLLRLEPDLAGALAGEAPGKGTKKRNRKHTRPRKVGRKK
jgi:hypothetical protein